MNLTYKFTEEAMVYATYSEGFRPGGINRRGTLPPYEADWLTNYEIGWKTTWFDNRLRWNGAVFSQTWDDFQFSLLGAEWLDGDNNAGAGADRRHRDGRDLPATDQFGDLGELCVARIRNSTDDFCGFVNADGKPRQQSPSVDDDGNDDCHQRLPKGTMLPVTPEWKANATARYDSAFRVSTATCRAR